MNTQKPIAFEIKIREHTVSPTRSPPIAQKLMKMSQEHEAPPSLEDIQQKLLRAEKNRKEELARKANTHTDEMTKKVLARKSTLEKEKLAAYEKEQVEKHGLAEQLRMKALSDRVHIAKKESSKLD